MQASDGQAQLNYALCLQFVYRDYDQATHYYLRGLQADPYNTNIMENFNLMLFNLKGSDDDGFELMLRYQAEQAEEEDLRRLLKQMERSAVKIQSTFRARKTRLAVHGAHSVYREKMAIDTWPDFDKYDKGAIEVAMLQDLIAACGKGRGMSDDALLEAAKGLNVKGDGMIYKEVFVEFWKTGELPDETAEDAADWEVCTADDGETFYYDKRSGESTFKKPRFKRGELALMLKKHHDGAGSGDDDDDDDADGEEGTEDPADWEECDDGEGEIFYYNNRTGESVWTKPKFRRGGSERVEEDGTEDPTDWEECDDDEGNTFYYNNR